MERNQILRLFEAHREAEPARDIDGILSTFVPTPFLETVPLGLRSEGRDAVRAANEIRFFSAFPDLAPEDEGLAFGDDTVVVSGKLSGPSRGDWLGVPAGGSAFAVPFANVVPLPRWANGRGEIIYFDLATLCKQAGSRSKPLGPLQRRVGPYECGRAEASRNIRATLLIAGYLDRFGKKTEKIRHRHHTGEIRRGIDGIRRVELSCECGTPVGPWRDM
jgi:hypothetical protein